MCNGDRALADFVSWTKASSTLMLALAEVSRNMTPSSSARPCPCSVVMTCAEAGHATVQAEKEANLLLVPITLVAYQDLVDALGSVLLDVGVPRPDVCHRCVRSEREGTGRADC
jgi:hypothetical protein